MGDKASPEKNILLVPNLTNFSKKKVSVKSCNFLLLLHQFASWLFIIPLDMSFNVFFIW